MDWSLAFWLGSHVYIVNCSSVKNRVIGNKRQKVNLINQGIIMRLLNILNDEQQPDNIRVESVIVLGSLAKSQDEHVITILSSGAIEVLIRGILHTICYKCTSVILTHLLKHLVLPCVWIRKIIQIQSSLFPLPQRWLYEYHGNDESMRKVFCLCLKFSWHKAQTTDHLDRTIMILVLLLTNLIFAGLGHQNVKYVELCLCCLRSLVQSPVCPRDFIYADPRIVSHLLSLVDMSVNAQACVATILAECCQVTLYTLHYLQTSWHNLSTNDYC